MSKEKGKTQNKKRKLTRQEKKQIDALIRQSKGDGKPHTAQDSIPFERMYKDGICRLANGRYSKCIEFEDINYQLAQPDDKTAIFEALCDMYNSFDASISVQLSLISRHANKEDFKSSITIAPQNDDFDSIRAEYTEMLQTQLERGNNGLIKTKFLTFTIEAKDIKSARARLARIETDTLNHFKVIGAAARVLDGKQRLEVLHGLFHPDGERFNFAWEWLPVSGLSVKDFIAPSSFRFGDGRMFQMGGKFGAVSFLQIAAPELSDRMLADFMEAENGIVVNLHIQSIDHNEAIKTIKRKITDLDRMKIEEQKKEITGEPKNLEEQAISLVGRDIYEKLVKGYTEKQWGRDCRELPAFIIKRLPVRLTFDNNYFNALYQGIPIGGYTKMVENLLDGIEVRLNTDYLEHKAELDALADKVVYTGPIDAYFGFKLGTLEYRSVRFENETLDIPNFQGNAAVNYTDRETPWTRIIEHKWFEFGKDEDGNDLTKTIISREYSSEWKAGDEPYYPVNDEKNGQLYAKYKELADKETGVIFGGRLGEYKYYDMDTTIASVLDMCEKELG